MTDALAEVWHDGEGGMLANRLHVLSSQPSFEGSKEGLRVSMPGLDEVVES